MKSIFWKSISLSFLSSFLFTQLLAFLRGKIYPVYMGDSIERLLALLIGVHVFIAWPLIQEILFFVFLTRFGVHRRVGLLLYVVHYFIFEITLFLSIPISVHLLKKNTMGLYLSLGTNSQQNTEVIVSQLVFFLLYAFAMYYVFGMYKEKS